MGSPRRRIGDVMASSSGASLLKGRWTIWIIALVFSLLAGFGVLTIIGSAAEQRIYYVVAADVPARTPITLENTTPRTTSADGYPDTAVTLEQLETGQLFSRIGLKSGEVVTTSNSGPLVPITETVPDDFVAVSLSVAPENAVGGRIKAGDLVDIAAVSESGSSRFAKIVLSGVQVLDVAVSPSTIASAATTDQVGPNATGPDSVPARSGIPQLYTFAVSLEDFAALALLRDKNVYLALSSPDDANADRTAEAYESDLFGTAPSNGEEFVFDEEVIVQE